MITNPFLRSALHEHAEPAQRILGAEQLAPDSDALACLLTGDPAPEVRVAAARRCADLAVLAAAWEKEADAAVRGALAAALLIRLPKRRTAPAHKRCSRRTIAAMRFAPKWPAARRMRNAAASRLPAYALKTR